jgi:nucleoside 2-deoxyribosyltransferase
MKTGFFAYSGQPKSVGESIEEAIRLINDSGIASLRSWRSFTINGQLIIDEVTKAIDEAEYFCADLTGFSDNVIFELGYAMAKNKRIFLTLDDSYIDSLRRYKELSSLTTIGYKKYVNSYEIIEAFNSFVSAKNLLVRQQKRQSSNFGKPLLFLKSQFDTQYSRAIASKISEYKIPCTTDDASESRVQPIGRKYKVRATKCSRALKLLLYIVSSH